MPFKKLISPLSYLILGLALIFSLAVYTNGTAHEGDPCKFDHIVDTCDASLTFLECDPIELVCRCPGNLTVSSYFDKFDEKCHSHVNASCIPKQIPCPINGYCPLMDDQKFCRCDPGMGITSGKKCAKNFGAPCTASSQCDGDGGMLCLGDLPVRRTCDCNATTSIYNPDLKKCVLKLGQICQTPGDQACPVGAECEETSQNIFTCQCKSGLVPTPDGQCRALFGQSCSVENGENCDESKFLICNTQNLCQCHYDLVTTPLGECRSKFGAECDPAGISGEPLCSEIDFLTCAPYHKCVCQDGLTDVSGDGDGKCRADFGHSCAPSSEICDESKFLTCSPTTKICQCAPHLIDIGEGHCVVPLHGFCNETSGLKCAEGQFTQCDDDDDDPKCQCRDGLVENGKGECKVGFGAICHHHEAPGCDDTKFLECHQKIRQCQCRQGMKMVAYGDEGEAECQSKFGSSCAAGEKCQLGGNLECDAVTKICGCRAGFKNRPDDHGDGQCVEDGYFYYYLDDGQAFNFSIIFFLAIVLLGAILLAYVIHGCTKSSEGGSGQLFPPHFPTTDKSAEAYNDRNLI